MGQNPNRTPSEHPNPHSNRVTWVVHPPQNGTIGFDAQPYAGLVIKIRTQLEHAGKRPNFAMSPVGGASNQRAKRLWHQASHKAPGKVSKPHAL